MYWCLTDGQIRLPNYITLRKDENYTISILRWAYQEYEWDLNRVALLNGLHIKANHFYRVRREEHVSLRLWGKLLSYALFELLYCTVAYLNNISICIKFLGSSRDLEKFWECIITYPELLRADNIPKDLRNAPIWFLCLLIHRWMPIYNWVYVAVSIHS